MAHQDVLNFFNGDELAASVWEKKYKFKDEITPKDSFARYCKEIAEKEIQRANTFSLYKEIDDCLSEYGKYRWYRVKQNASCTKEKAQQMMENYFSSFINFDNIVLGGSMLATIGNHKSYSSLSNCFVLGRPHDSYAGINQKTFEMCEVMKRRGGCVEQHTKVIIRGKNNERIIKEIKDVKIGDYILSFNIKTGEDEWKRVNDHYIVDNVEINDQIEYTYQNGVKLKTSRYHPVLILRDGKYDYASYSQRPENHPLYNILPDWFNNGSLNCVNKTPNKNYIKQHYDEKLSDIAWLIGAHLGDGTADIVNNRFRVRLKKSDFEPIQHYCEIHNKLFECNNSVVQKNDNLYHYCSMGNYNQEFFEKYLDNQINSKTYTAKVPNFIKLNNLWIPFIAGLIDTDGFYNEGNGYTLEITTCAKPMMSEIIDYLYCINAKIFVAVKPAKDNASEKYLIKFYPNTEIYNEISKYLINPKRKPNFDKIISKSPKVPATNEEYLLICSNNYKYKLSNTDKSFRNRFKKDWLIGDNGINYLRNQELVNENKISEIQARVNQSSIKFDDEIKQVYYDISVEDNNNYYAGNFGFVVIHNCGHDLSGLRPDGAKVHNQSSESCGPVLFAQRFANITSEVALRGRRGALMLSMQIAHPNSIEFAESKQDLSKITGANISVIVDKEFMKAVMSKTDNTYIQHFPVDVPIENFAYIDVDDLQLNKKVENSEMIKTVYEYKGKIETGYIRYINAKEAWDRIIHCAWTTAEPGIIFYENWLQGGTDSVYDHYKPITTNPCSEIPMQPYDSCRLASINLYSFVNNPFTDRAEFDFKRFYEVAYEQICILDNIVDLEGDYIQRIINKIQADENEPVELKNQTTQLWGKIYIEGKAGRRLGAGFTGLGDTLAALGLNYNDSVNTQCFLTDLFREKMKAELDATTDLAVLFGTFNGYDFDKEYYENSEDIIGRNRIFKTIQDEFPEQFNRMMKYGRRNVSWSTAAPTGSLSILTQTTSGIEPLFLPYYKRRKKCITDDERVDYIDPADGQKFTEFFVLHPKFKEYLKLTRGEQFEISTNEQYLFELFSKSPWFDNCANDITWIDRVNIQAIVQKYTTHSISSTINLPSDVAEKDISNIYLESYRAGLKGNTVYRDGCRGGVLVSVDSKQQKSDNTFEETHAPKRPRTLPAFYHTLHSAGKTYSVIIGLYENKPYEVFIASGLDNMPENLDEFEDKISGEIVREDKNWYNFESDTFVLRDIADVEHDEKMISLMISMALRHRTPLKFVIKTLNKMQPIAGSFTHRLIKILSQYMSEDDSKEIYGDTCPECGSKLRHENGCVICANGCGWSKCS